MSTNPFATAGVELHVLVDDVPLLESNAMLVRNIIVESQLNLPAMCEIELIDPAEQIGAKLLLQACRQTDSRAGDGTTTAAVLTQAIVRAGAKLSRG